MRNGKEKKIVMEEVKKRIVKEVMKGRKELMEEV